MHFISGAFRCARLPELESPSKVNLINPDARANRVDFRMRSSCGQFRMRERGVGGKGHDSYFNETQIKFAQMHRVRMKKKKKIFYVRLVVAY